MFKSKFKSLTKNIDELNEKINKLKTQWESEKSLIQGEANLKDDIDATKHEIEIATVHLHDNDGTADSHNPLGTGKIDFISFINELKNHNHNPYLIIEHWSEFNKSIEYLENNSLI